MALFLSLSLITGPISPLLAQADDYTDGLGKRAFLLDLKERVKYFMQMNHVYLQGVEACLSGEPSLLKCESEISKIRQNIKVNYSEIRRHWILMGFVRWQAMRFVFTNYREVLWGHQTGKSGRVTIPLDKLMVDNPIETHLSEESIPVISPKASEVLAALHMKTTRFEKTQVYENWNDYLQYVCAQAIGKSQAASVCGPIRLEMAVGENGALSVYVDADKSKLPQMKNVELILQNIEFKTQFWMSDFYKEQENKFYELIQENPYVALVTSENPTNLELLKVFRLMLNRSSESLSEFNTKWGVLDRQDIDTDSLLPLMEYAPVADDVLNVHGENMDLLGREDYQEIRNMLNTDYSDQELKQMLKDIGFLIVANVAVCAAGGRLVKWAGTLKRLATSARLMKLKEVFNPLCFNLTGVAVNVWFIRDAKQNYSKVYRDIFSYADNNGYLREFRALPEAEQMIFWSYMMAPVGVGATVVLKAMATRGVKLSQGFQKYLAERMAATRPIPQ